MSYWTQHEGEKEAMSLTKEIIPDWNREPRRKQKESDEEGGGSQMTGGVKVWMWRFKEEDNDGNEERWN